MEINFEKIIVPNFIRTDKGTFALKDLSEEEITEYAEAWVSKLQQRRKEQIDQ